VRGRSREHSSSVCFGLRPRVGQKNTTRNPAAWRPQPSPAMLAPCVAAPASPPMSARSSSSSQSRRTGRHRTSRPVGTSRLPTRFLLLGAAHNRLAAESRIRCFWKIGGECGFLLFATAVVTSLAATRRRCPSEKQGGTLSRPVVARLGAAVRWGCRIRGPWSNARALAT